MAIKQRNIHPDWRLAGVFASAAAYLTSRNKSAASEGDVYYDTTLSQLRTYDGSSWSPAGQNGISAGSLDEASQVGAKITNTDQIEIERSYASGAVFVLDQNNAGASARCANFENASNNAASITANFASTNGYDISGTGATWKVDYNGVGTFTDLVLGDDEAITFGASSDITLQWDQTKLVFSGAAADSAIHIGDATNLDLVIFGDTTTDAVTFDTSAEDVQFNGFDLTLFDDDILNFGDDDDLSIVWDQANLLIEPKTQDTGQIRIGSTNAMDLAIYDNGASGLVLFDVSTSIIKVNGWDLNLQDDDILQLGDSNDVTLSWDQTKLNMTAAGANTRWLIGTGAVGFDVEIYMDNGTVKTDWSADLMILDACDLRINDGDFLLLGDSANGSSADAAIYWDQTNLKINAFTGRLQIDTDVQIGTASSDEENLTVNGDLSVTGSFTHTGSYNPGAIAFDDNEILSFGDDTDITMTWDETQLVFSGAAANNAIHIGDATNLDLVIFGGTTTNAITFDTDDSALTCTFNGFDLYMLDDDVIAFGDAQDITMTWDQTKLVVSGAAADSAIHIGDANNLDLVIFGDNTNDAVTFDTSAESMELNGFDLTLMDDDLLKFGDSDDLTMEWDTAELDISGSAANTGIAFGKTNTVDVDFAGTNYNMQWDASRDMLTFADDAILGFGGTKDSAADATIMWDQTELVIDAVAANGTVAFGKTVDTDVSFNGTTAGVDCEWNASANTLHFIDNSVLGIGGAADASPDITITWDSTNNDLLIDGAAANTEIKIGASNNQDFLIYGDTATDIVTFDTSEELCHFNGFDLQLKDDDKLIFGDSTNADIVIQWDQTELQFDAGTANGTISFGKSTDTDITFNGTTASKDVEWNASSNMMHWLDDAVLGLGGAADAAADITMTWDQTQLVFSGAAADSAIHIGDATNLDLVIFGDTTTDAITFDTSEEDVRFNGFDLTLLDDDILNFGDTDDITITYDSTNDILLIDGAAADTVISIGAANNQDVVIYGDSTSQDVEFDTSAETVTFTDFNLTMSGTTSAVITCAYQSDFGGLAIPTHATSSPTGTPATASMFFEVDATKLWVHIGGGTWKGVALT